MIEVVAAIVRRDEKILITRRHADAHLGGLWEFPGGKVEAGETLRGALKREIREELGIGIEVLEERYETEFHDETRSLRLHFFECVISDGNPAAIDVGELKWVFACELALHRFPEADERAVQHLLKP